MHSFNTTWAVCSRFQLIWLVSELQDFIAHVVIIRIPLGIGGDESLVNQPSPTLSSWRSVTSGMFRIISRPKAKPPGVVLNVVL